MAERSRVLVIDDDQMNLDLLGVILSQCYDVVTAVDGESGVQLAHSLHPDAVLVDIGLPKLDGISVCEAIRKDDAMRFTPILVVTGRNTEEDRMRSFLKGADDFLAKPFGSKELLVRLDAKMKRARETLTLVQKTKMTSSPQMTCGNLTLDLDKIEARVANESVALSVLEFELLKFFVENRERVLSRNRILQAVWNDAVVIDRTVDTHVSGLRKKLSGCSYNLKTVYGAGYIFKPAG